MTLTDSPPCWSPCFCHRNGSHSALASHTASHAPPSRVLEGSHRSVHTTHTPHHKHTDSQEFSSSFLSCLLQALCLPWEGSLHTLPPVKRIRWAEGKLLGSLKKKSPEISSGPFLTPVYAFWLSAHSCYITLKMCRFYCVVCFRTHF